MGSDVNICLTRSDPFPQVLGLALAQHDRLVTSALGAQRQDAALCESLMKQHTRQEGCACPWGAESGGVEKAHEQLLVSTELA